MSGPTARKRSVKPAAPIVTPAETWISRPRAWKADDRRWKRQVEAIVERYRGGHCIVEAICRPSGDQ